VLAALVMPLLAVQAPAAETAVVLVVKSAAAGPYDQAVHAFQGAMRGHDVRVVDLAGDRSRLARAAQSARAAGVALVVAVGPLAVEAVRGAGRPVIYVLTPDGAVAGLRGNATGVRMGVHPARHLALVKRLLPRARRVAVLDDPARSSWIVSEGREAARPLRLLLAETRVQDQRAVPFAVRGLRADALWLILDDTVVTRTSYPLILRTTLEARIPTITFSQDLVRAGALAALEADFADTGVKAAELARQVLGGRSPSELAPVWPAGRLHLNERVAQRLSISLPTELQRFAGRVLPP
jgi:putative ABC transport system substrate-binding protein